MEENTLIHARSSSRVGVSDLGVNPDRLDSLISHLEPGGSQFAWVLTSKILDTHINRPRRWQKDDNQDDCNSTCDTLLIVPISGCVGQDPNLRNKKSRM